MGLLALDDRDATIVYSTGWGQAGSANEFNSTTTFTNTVGATAKVTFYGTKITVFGTIAGSLVRKPTSTYQIDSGTTTTFEGDPGLTTKFNQAFFESPTLPAGEHTLTITNTGDDASLFLDLLMVTPLDTPMVTTVTTTATPPAVTSARTVTVTQSAQGGSPSGTAAGSVDSAATGGSQRSSNTGAIVGGIIGALALLVLLVGGFLFYRKRQRQMRADTSAAANYNWNTNPEKPPTPLAPQFQSQPWGQPPMSQNTGGGSATAGYGAASYEPWQTYPTPPRQYAPPSSTYNNTGPSAPLPPLPSSSHSQEQGSSDLAYYSNNDAYGGYTTEQQGPYPPLPAKSAQGRNLTGRVRVNLDGP